jgi:sugar lactone lactonase YvrE
MPTQRARKRAVLWSACFLLFVLDGCVSAARSSPTAVPSATAPATTASIAPTPTTAMPPPSHYTTRILLHGGAHPDDLAFDAQGQLLFSDVDGGTVNRLNVDGSVTVLVSGLAGPEGMVALPDGTLLISEQRTNRVLGLAPGATSPSVLRDLPGAASSAPCKDGMDDIALDPTGTTIIVPDSPTGQVYRMSLDGRSLTLLAGGIARPVGAAVDARGNVFVADECGGAIWRIAPSRATSALSGFGAPDDVAFDPQGDLLVVDLAVAVHALIRLDPRTGHRQVLASDSLVEPQGLLVDGRGDIFVSDEAGGRIVEFVPG